MGTRVVHAAAAMLTFALAAAACTSQADKVVIPPDEEPTTEETGPRVPDVLGRWRTLRAEVPVAARETRQLL
jgi:hypothetical protein